MDGRMDRKAHPHSLGSRLNPNVHRGGRKLAPMYLLLMIFKLLSDLMVRHLSSPQIFRTPSAFSVYSNFIHSCSIIDTLVLRWYCLTILPHFRPHQPTNQPTNQPTTNQSTNDQPMD